MPEAFKDSLFSPAQVDALAGALAGVYPAFDRAAYQTRVYDAAWEGRALKARMRHLTEVIHGLLPQDYWAALDILYRALPAIRTIGGFVNLIPCDFVEQYGQGDWEASLPALEAFTQIGSAEFAVRPFIHADPDRILAQMRVWAGHDHPGVRRLASEGSRPRLPWGMALPALKADPAPLLPILEALKDDPSEDVRRSVANNLNDIAKDNPAFTVAVARRWLADPTPEREALVRHALRTLIKQGDPDALALLGYGTGGDFVVKDLGVTPETIAEGEAITLSFTIESQADTPLDLMIDYVVYHQRASGQQTPKVFKLTKRQLAPGETLTLSKRHSFKPVTTRRYYPGPHAVAVQINGVLSERVAFTLT